MIKHLILVLPLSIFLLISCNKNKDLKKGDVAKPDLPSLANSTIYSTSMSPSDVCDPVLDDTDEDSKRYSIFYQLTDALRANMTDEILDYIYAQQQYKMANFVETEAATIYYDDLFVEFPTLEADIDDYLDETNFGLTHEYDNYNSMAAVFTDEDLAVWIPNIELLPASYDPDIDNYIIAAAIQIDFEDLDSEDRIFAWEYTDGTVATVSIGETASATVAAGSAGSVAKATFVSGQSRAKGTTFDPPVVYFTTQPPYSTSNPWGYGHGGNINRIKINQRYERNKYSEVRLCNMWGKYDGTYDGDNPKLHVKNVHKNDIGVDLWITPVWLFNMVDNTEDRVFVYNMYERDWFFLSKSLYYLGGLLNTNYTWKHRMWARMGSSGDYYMAQRDGNHHKNINERLDHPFSHTLYNNGTVLNTGLSGTTLITYY